MEVRVRVRARKTRITKEADGIVYLDVAATPEQNKANKEIERFLSKHTGKTARIISGFTSKRKIVKLE